MIVFIKLGGIPMKTSKKNLAIFFLMIAALLFVVSCEYKAPVETPVVKNEALSSPSTFVLVKGTEIVKAELHICVKQKVNTDGSIDPVNGKEVGVFETLKSWSESTTWNSFYSTSPQYGDQVASFTPTDWGYLVVTSADLTELVQSWIDGGTNYGIFLKQIEACGGPSFRELYHSSEAGSCKPFLRIYLSATEYVDDIPAMDTEILEVYPNEAWNIDELGTGFGYNCEYEKQSLLIWDFDLEEEEDGGCSLTPGYWKTHSINGPAPYDDIWAQIGETTPFFSSGTSWYGALWTEPKGNPYWILAHAYIAAHLNDLNDADFTVAQAAFDAATTLFENNTPADAGALKGAAKAEWTNLATILDNYNNGLIGPGHCD